MKKLLFILAFAPVLASAATCYAVTSGNWNTASIWASTIGGSGGSCAAAGGSGVTIMGQTATLAAHVPGVAGGTDRAVIKTGITVHITAGVGVELGESTFSASTDSLTVNATNSSTYGALIIDNQGLLKLHGASSSNDNYITIQQYAVVQVSPGGSIWISTGQNSPAIGISGRFYVGCGDQTAYPTPVCGGNAGAWVTPSVASTLNFTATALPSGLAVNDLVELSPIPQPLSFAYPYQIDGVTPPPDPPILPQTSDTGTSPMKTCGSASTCLVPNDTLLCVVAISGNSVSLGWPQGGNPSQPYCAGTETALAVTNAGKGQLWMKKPAFFWGDPGQYTWNNSKSFTMTANTQTSPIDMIRSGFSTNFQGPVSNVAGTGPGRHGDTSMSFSSNNWGGTNSSAIPCAFLSIDAVTSSGCWLDNTTSQIVAYGYQLGFSGSMTWKAPSAMFTLNGSVSVPAGSRTYNEMLFTNADLRYVYNSVSSGHGFIQFSTLPNTANNHAAFVNNTVSMSRQAISIEGITLSSSTPLSMTRNSFGSAPNNVAAPISFEVTSSYIDISNNYLQDYTGMFRCALTSGSRQTFDHLTDVNNQVLGLFYSVIDNNSACNWTNRYSADNRITGFGGAPTTPSYAVAYGTQNSYSANPNNVYKSNYVYGVFRGMFLASGAQWNGNYIVFPWHHVNTVTSFDSAVVSGRVGGLATGLKVDHNIFAAASNEQMPCFNSGYNEYILIDGFEFSNNTCLVSGNAGSGGFEIGDTDSNSSTALAGMKIHSNIFGTTLGVVKEFQGSPNFVQSAITYAGWNSEQGTQQMYSGFSTNPNAIPNPEMNRTVFVTQGGNNYNLSGSRNITGVSIQNPSYPTALTGGCLKYNYTDQSNITMQWSIDCTNYGTAAQLNWAGASTTYTISATPTAVGGNSMSLTVSGTPFTGLPITSGGGNTVPAGCPTARWLWAMSGTDIGQGFSILTCPGTYNVATNSLGVVPQDATNLGTAQFSVINMEVRLADAAGVTTTCNTTNNSSTVTVTGSTTGLHNGMLVSGTGIPAGTTMTISGSTVTLNINKATATNTGVSLTFNDYIDVGIDARSLPRPSPGSLIDTGISITPKDYCNFGSSCTRSVVVSGLPTTTTPGTTNLPLVPVAMPILGGSAEQAFCNGNPKCGGTSYYVPSGTAWKFASPSGGYIGAVPPLIIGIPAPAWW
jgi:hypothetical protein